MSINRIITALNPKHGFNPKDVNISHINDWKELENLDGADWFTSSLWSYGDYVGTTVERSNYESLKKFLDNNNIEYLVASCSYSYKTLVIKMSEWQENNGLDNIIQGLDNYPLIDENHFLELEGELEHNYITGDFKQFEVKSDINITDDDIIEAYYNAYDTMGYGIQFETGCVPYLHKDLKEEIARELKLKGYHDVRI